MTIKEIMGDVRHHHKNAIQCFNKGFMETGQGLIDTIIVEMNQNPTYEKEIKPYINNLQKYKIEVLKQ